MKILGERLTVRCGMGAVTQNTGSSVVVLAAVLLVSTGAFAQGSLLDASFDPTAALHPGANSSVDFVVQQPHGKLLILEHFLAPTSTMVSRISRLDALGRPDSTFVPGVITSPVADVYQVTLEPDGRIFIGGNFSSFNGIAVNNLIRLNTNGTLDTSFNVGAYVTDLSTYSMAGQPDGKLLIPAVGTRYANGVPASWNLARLNTDGSADSTFHSSTDGRIYAVAVRPDGRILVGGDFTSVNGTPGPLIAQLQLDGTLDPGFSYTNSAVGAQVRLIALQTDGRILVVGLGLSPSGLARLNVDGSVDSGFDAGSINGSFGIGNVIKGTLLAPQPQGTLLIGGSFTAIDGINRNGVARLMPDGALDLGFDPGAGLALDPNSSLTQPVRALAVQSDGKVLVGGAFSTVGGVPHPELVRFIPGDPSEESLLNFWNYRGNAVSVREDATNLAVMVARAGATSSNVTVHFQTADGSAIAGVNYRATGGILTFAPGVRTQTFNIPILDDHRISGDTTFTISLTDPTGGASLGSSSNVTVTVNDVDLGIEFAQTNYLTDVLQSSVKIPLRLLGTHLGGRGFYFHAPVAIDYATGEGTAVAGRDYDLAAGTIDYSPSSVEVPPPPPSFVITLHDDTSAYGDHTVQLNLANPSSNLVLGSMSNAVLTIKNDNTAAGVEVGLNGPIQAMVVQPDGKVVVGGKFTLIDGQPRNHLARLYPNGLLDPTFNPGSGTEGDILALARQTDGRIVVGGTFTNLNGVYCGRIARLNADGSVDRSFNPGSGWLAPAGVSAGVTALAVQSDGRILSGSPLTNFDGASRIGIARLNADGTLDPTFVPAIQPIIAEWPGFAISGVASLTNGQVVVGGHFRIPPNGAHAGLAVLNTDGSVDTNFPDLFFGVVSLAVGPDGDILAAAPGDSGYLPVFKLRPEGEVEPGFPPTSLSLGLGSITLQSDGKILVTGNPAGWSIWYNQTYYDLLRLNSDGSVDASFQGMKSHAGERLDRTVALPDGSIWATGTFTEGITGRPFYLRRLNPDGTDIQDLRFLSPVRLPNGEVHLALRGQWATPYLLQASEDLANWTTVATNDRPHVPIGYIDHDAANYPHRFYRFH